MAEEFYWRHARDSLLTPTALRMFQLVASREGQVFDEVKDAIDEDYLIASGNADSARHGGIIQTQFQVFREAGWATLSDTPAGAAIEITPAGKQALLLLAKVPDFLKAAPYFIVELLARLQLNNPARPNSSRNADYDSALADATVFPYWTLLKVMRSLGGKISSDELRRFVFKIKRNEDVDTVITSIRSYRNVRQNGATEEDLDNRFGKALEGAIGEPKYLMGRLGTQVGKNPPLLEKIGVSEWELNRYYLPFIDTVLADEPIYREHVTESSWMQEYGQPVNVDEQQGPPDSSPHEALPTDLPDEDEVLSAVNELIEEGSRAILFSGPPGTSKTWYARKIAGKLVDGQGDRVRFVQFHPSMGYDDFVEGYVPKVTADGASFEVIDKVFLRLCKVAEATKPSLCVLVIDEVNRGDLGRILGELLTYIEPDYREHQFQLAYSGRTVKIPSNLVLLGTLNPFDKSVVELDDAIDRRFDRISLEPSTQKLRSILTDGGVDEALIMRLTQFFVDANKLMRHGIGHALFLSIKDDTSLRRLWTRKLQYIFEKAFRFELDSLTTIKQKYLELFENSENSGI